MLYSEIYVIILIQFYTFEKGMNIYLGSIELLWDFNDIYSFYAIIDIVLGFFTYLLVLLAPDVDEFCCCVIVIIIIIIWFNIFIILDFHLSSFAKEDLKEFSFQLGLTVSNKYISIYIYIYIYIYNYGF